jgi:hypothetical protein
MDAKAYLLVIAIIGSAVLVFGAAVPYLVSGNSILSILSAFALTIGYVPIVYWLGKKLSAYITPDIKL